METTETHGPADGQESDDGGDAVWDVCDSHEDVSEPVHVAVACSATRRAPGGETVKGKEQKEGGDDGGFAECCEDDDGGFAACCEDDDGGGFAERGEGDEEAAGVLTPHAAPELPAYHLRYSQAYRHMRPVCALPLYPNGGCPLTAGYVNSRHGRHRDPPTSEETFDPTCALCIAALRPFHEGCEECRMADACDSLSLPPISDPIPPFDSSLFNDLDGMVPLTPPVYFPPVHREVQTAETRPWSGEAAPPPSRPKAKRASGPTSRPPSGANGTPAKPRRRKPAGAPKVACVVQATGAIVSESIAGMRPARIPAMTDTIPLHVLRLFSALKIKIPSSNGTERNLVITPRPGKDVAQCRQDARTYVLAAWKHLQKTASPTRRITATLPGWEKYVAERVRDCGTRQAPDLERKICDFRLVLQRVPGNPPCGKTVTEQGTVCTACRRRLTFVGRLLRAVLLFYADSLQTATERDTVVQNVITRPGGLADMVAWFVDVAQYVSIAFFERELPILFSVFFDAAFLRGSPPNAKTTEVSARAMDAFISKLEEAPPRPAAQKRRRQASPSERADAQQPRATVSPPVRPIMMAGNKRQKQVLA